MSNKILGRIDNLETRLAANSGEIAQSQYLRYRIFYEEMAAIANDDVLKSKKDVDFFDEFCDHLLVIDRLVAPCVNSLNSLGQIVGSYRLLNQHQAASAGGFYSGKQFEIEKLVQRHIDKQFLEFGRSCVLPNYRTKRTIELLWQGSWAHVRDNKVDVMFGCASFSQKNPEKIAHALSYLYHHSRAKGTWRVDARGGAQGANNVEMNIVERDDIDQRAALRQLPPLIKGYLRLGAMFGERAVIDHQFGTIDVLIILPITHLNPRYVKFYGQNAERYRAR